MTSKPILTHGSFSHRLFLTAVLFLTIALVTSAQVTQSAPQASEAKFDAIEVMVPMRDGLKLHTVICTPKATTESLPILMQRTPYGASTRIARFLHLSQKELADDGYIFVFQDIRGKNGSEGQFRMNRPPRDRNDSKSVDESSD